MSLVNLPGLQSLLLMYPLVTLQPSLCALQCLKDQLGSDRPFSIPSPSLHMELLEEGEELLQDPPAEDLLAPSPSGPSSMVLLDRCSNLGFSRHSSPPWNLRFPICKPLKMYQERLLLSRRR